MFVPDVNVLLYATDASSARHAPCARWLAGALEGDAPVGFSWQVLLGFIRLATRAVVFSRPLSVVEAFDVVDDWLGRWPAWCCSRPSDTRRCSVVSS